MGSSRLKAVPAVPEQVDLSEFRRSLRGLPLWRSILEQLGPDDEAKLRAALLAPSIPPKAIIDWLKARRITISYTVVARWREYNFAATA